MNRPRRLQPLLHLGLPFLLLALGVTAQLQLTWHWIALDQRLGDGVCCGSVEPLMAVVQSQAAGHALPFVPAWTWVGGWMPWVGWLSRAFLTRSPDFPLYAVSLTVLLAQVALFFLTRRLSGPWTGLLAALILPCLPAVAYMTRRWDAMAPQWLLIILAVWLLLASRGLTRLLPSLLLALLLSAGLLFSPHPTDNFLFALALAGAVAGSLSRGLLLSRGPQSEPLTRWPMLPGLLLVLAGVGSAGWILLQGGVHPAYYAQELGNQAYSQAAAWWQGKALLAYSSHLFLRDLGPIFSLLWAISLISWLRKGPARGELLGWMLLPLVVLSVIAKKNFYYLSVIYPAFPLTLALGLHALASGSRGRKILASGLGAALLTFLVLGLVARTLPASRLAQALSGMPWEPIPVEASPLFQTHDGGLNLAPSPDFPLRPALLELAPLLGGPSCACPQEVALLDDPPTQDVWLFLSRVDPCLNVQRFPQVRWRPSVRWVLARDPLEALKDVHAEWPASRPWAWEAQQALEDSSFVAVKRFGVGEKRYLILERKPEVFATSCPAR